MGRSRKPLWGFAPPWVRIPPSPQYLRFARKLRLYLLPDLIIRWYDCQSAMDLRPRSLSFNWAISTFKRYSFIVRTPRRLPSLGACILDRLQQRIHTTNPYKKLIRTVFSCVSNSTHRLARKASHCCRSSLDTITSCYPSVTFGGVERKLAPFGCTPIHRKPIYFTFLTGRVIIRMKQVVSQMQYYPIAVKQ
jgi:hypothetical protein